MKFFQAITILLLVSYVYMTDYCSKDVTSPTKTEDCTSVKAGEGYCCFVKSNGKNRCEPIGPTFYKNIKDYAKFFKKCNLEKGDNEGDCKEDSDFSIDCKSSYLVLSLLSLLLLFL